MVSLCAGAMTAFLLGLLLWGGRFALICLALLLCGGSFLRSRTGRVFREIGTGFYILFGSCATIVFLYYVNHGMFRWFLCGALLTAFLSASYLASRHLLPAVADRIEGMRGVIKRWIICILSPIGKLFLLCKVRFLYMAGKITLPIKKKYGKIKASIKDRMKRRHLERSFSDMLKRMSRETEHEHQRNQSR